MNGGGDLGGGTLNHFPLLFCKSVYFLCSCLLSLNHNPLTSARQVVPGPSIYLFHLWPLPLLHIEKLHIILLLAFEIGSNIMMR